MTGGTFHASLSRRWHAADDLFVLSAPGAARREVNKDESRTMRLERGRGFTAGPFGRWGACGERVPA